MHKQRPSPDRPARRPWLAAAVLLAVLPGVVAAIILARGQGGPAALPEPADQAQPLVVEVVMQPEYAAGEPPGQFGALAALLPRPADDSTFRISTAAQQWPANRMYEKIDGEDKAYLKHGCTGLAAATLKHRDSGVTIEMFLYRMADGPAAEAVFNEQAPSPDAPDPRDRPEWVAIGDRAYLSYGCCYLRAGAHYLKLLAAAETPAAGGEVRRLARRFVEHLQSRRHAGTGTQ